MCARLADVLVFVCEGQPQLIPNCSMLYITFLLQRRRMVIGCTATSYKKNHKLISGFLSSTQGLHRTHAV